MKFILFLTTVSTYLWAPSLWAQAFYFKGEQDQILVRKIPFELHEDYSITFKKPEALEDLTSTQFENRIERRVPTKAEQIIDTSFSLLTGLTLILTHDSYDIAPDLRLTSNRQILFFIFPIESHLLYKRCHGEQYLIATSRIPDDETLKEMKTISEAKEICQEQKNEDQS